MLLTTEPSTQATLSGSTNGDLHAKPRGQTRRGAGSPNPEEHRGTKSQAGDQSPQSNAEGPRNGDGSSSIRQQTNVASSGGLGPSPACRPLHQCHQLRKGFCHSASSGPAAAGALIQGLAGQSPHHPPGHPMASTSATLLEQGDACPWGRDTAPAATSCCQQLCSSLSCRFLFPVLHFCKGSPLDVQELPPQCGEDNPKLSRTRPAPAPHAWPAQARAPF